MAEQVLTDFPAAKPLGRIPHGAGGGALPQAEARVSELAPAPCQAAELQTGGWLRCFQQERGLGSSCPEAEPLCSYPKVTFIFDVRALLLRIPSVGDILTPLSPASPRTLETMQELLGIYSRSVSIHFLNPVSREAQARATHSPAGAQLSLGDGGRCSPDLTENRQGKALGSKPCSKL